MILWLYRQATNLGQPLIAEILRRRLAAGKEDVTRLDERRGYARIPRPSGRLVWLHAASIGEAVSILPAIERIQARPNTTALLTTGTVASAKLMAERLPPGAIHQYVPVDRQAWVRRFLDHWRPDLALWLESEFWPNLLTETAARGVPMLLLNGRVSPRSFARWLRYPGTARRLISVFELCLGQTELDAERLRSLGARRVAAPGNLKFAAPPLPYESDEFDRLSQLLGGRPRWLAASTHAGEETIVAGVHRALAERFPGLVTIIVPRHPVRGRAIAAELAASGLSVARRGSGESPAPNCDILLADTIGELGLFIRLSPIVFMGKSLVAGGGQNPLEPARLGASILFGPMMDNFAEVAARLEAANAACLVHDHADLASAVAARLTDPALVARESARARMVADEEAGVLDVVMGVIEPWLAGAGARP